MRLSIFISKVGLGDLSAMYWKPKWSLTSIAQECRNTGCLQLSRYPLVNNLNKFFLTFKQRSRCRWEQVPSSQHHFNSRSRSCLEAELQNPALGSTGVTQPRPQCPQSQWSQWENMFPQPPPDTQHQVRGTMVSSSLFLKDAGNFHVRCWHANIWT